LTGSQYPAILKIIKQREMLEMNITEKEMKVLIVIKETMEMYMDGFSDVMIEDIVGETEMSVSSVKGLLGTLYKKDLIDMMDVNGEYNVYYLTKQAQEHFGLDFE
jgi:predicted transcriptional regulator